MRLCEKGGCLRIMTEAEDMEMKELEDLQTNLTRGGEFSPSSCTPRYSAVLQNDYFRKNPQTLNEFRKSMDNKFTSDPEIGMKLFYIERIPIINSYLIRPGAGFRIQRLHRK